MTTRKKKPKPAILPGNLADPTGVDRLERGAMNEFAKRVKKASQAYIDALNRIPASPAVNKKYTFQLDLGLLTTLLNNAQSLVEEIMLQGGEFNLWFFDGYVKPSYQRGTAQEFANLSQQSDVYAAGQNSIADILLSDVYQRRLVLLRAREFEEMKGLSAGIVADMSRILTNGLGRGLPPRQIAKSLTEQVGIERRRANRIARTEITNALRTARWDEADQAEEEFGLRSMQMHFSALSPTTRREHALRHGSLYTTEQVREWYSINGNAINCKCTQITVLVDENNKPLNEKIIDMAKKRLEKAMSSGLAANMAHSCGCGHKHAA